MSLRHKTDKEPIELLLGLAGAVQYLEHSQLDAETYWVLVKTKTGTQRITIPIVAVQQIYSQKPASAVIAAIKRQLTDGPSSKEVIPTIKENSRPKVGLGEWFRSLLGMRK